MDAGPLWNTTAWFACAGVAEVCLLVAAIWALLWARETRFRSCIGLAAGLPLGYLLGTLALYLAFRGQATGQDALMHLHSGAAMTGGPVGAGLGALLGVWLGARRAKSDDLAKASQADD